MPFFADTNVCSKWESDRLLQQNWLAVKTQLESRGNEPIACPLVLIELLARLVRPEPKYFSRDLKSFLFLSKGQDKFLPLPGAFVLKTVLNVTSPVTAVHPPEFNLLLQCVVSATSREALSSGDVDLPVSPAFTYGIDFDVMTRQHQNGKTKHATAMTSMRQAKVIPSKEDFARGFLSSQRIVPAKGDVEAVAEALDAAYEYERFLLSELDLNYDHREHDSDWVDRQMLYYLADPNMYIVTNDKRVKNRCKRSKQSDRVLLV